MARRDHAVVQIRGTDAGVESSGGSTTGRRWSGSWMLGQRREGSWIWWSKSPRRCDTACTSRRGTSLKARRCVRRWPGAELRACVRACVRQRVCLGVRARVWVRVYVCERVSERGRFRLCTRTASARESSHIGAREQRARELKPRGRQVLIKERRKGRETEMRLFCEVLQELFSFHEVQMGEITAAVQLYLDLSGASPAAAPPAAVEAAQVCWLPALSDLPHLCVRGGTAGWFEQTPEDAVAFYGCMLSAAIARALVHARHPARPLVIQRSGGGGGGMAPTGLQREQLEALGRLLECGPERELNPDATPHPARGLIQLVLACAQVCRCRLPRRPRQGRACLICDAPPLPVTCLRGG